MRIAVDARFLHSKEFPALGDFTKEVFVRLAVVHPDHNFIFFTDQVTGEVAPLASNIIVETLPAKTSNFLSQKLWFDVKLPFALKKQKADLFIATYGTASLTTSVTQLLVLREIVKVKKGIFARRTVGSKSIKKAKGIVSLSEFVKQELVAQFGLPKELVKVIGSGTDAAFKPLGWEEREVIKRDYAEGCEYFVFAGGLEVRYHLLQVLQAFSIFKKWQKTNMKLLIIGSFVNDEKKILDKLKTYKYRNEVFLTKDLTTPEMAAAITASYCMIYPSLYEGFALAVLEAIKSNVPLITSYNSSMLEIAGDAALYAEPTRPEDIAEKMKRIFKDEPLRNKLVEAGMERADLYNWDKTASLLWEAILQTV